MGSVWLWVNIKRPNPPWLWNYVFENNNVLCHYIQTRHIFTCSNMFVRHPPNFIDTSLGLVMN